MKNKVNNKIKNKTKHGFFYKNKKILRLSQKVCPSYLPLTISEQMIQAVRPYLSLWLGARVIDKMMAGEPEKEIVRLAVSLVLVNGILALIQWLLDKILIVKRRRVRQEVNKSIARKSLTMDYQVLERSDHQDMITRAEEGERYSGGIESFAEIIGYLIQSMLSIVYGFFLLLPLLFGTGNQDSRNRLWNTETDLSFVNHPVTGIVYLFLFAVTVFVSYRIYARKVKENNAAFEEGMVSNRKYSYFMNYICNYKLGKGVRIFHMIPMIEQLFCKTKTYEFSIWHKMTRKDIVNRSMEVVVFALVQCMSYLLIGAKVMSGTVSIGELTMYVAVVQTLFSELQSVMEVVSMMDLRSKYLVNYVNFLELPNEKYDGTIPVEKRLDNEYELEFCDVSFHYPNSREPVLKHVNAKIRVGKKMAIVGRNGSGKSTFIKLLCRLYDPTEGEIRLNGIDIRKYDYDEYRTLFGVVFQDFGLFSFSIASNVAAAETYDEKRVKEALDQAGMTERIGRMEQGIETVLYKTEDEGVEISGGEEQKIAIARALYKDAPVVILDEPTAALDPISELEIYERFDEMVEEKTAIYISHRMSSCRFCENILVFDQGNIVEMGGHEELVQKKGLYAKLWEAQAQYYRG